MTLQDERTPTVKIVPVAASNNSGERPFIKHLQCGDIYIFPCCMECQRWLAMRKVSVSPPVSRSVRPSLKRVDCDKTEERSVQIFIPYQRSFSLVFWEEEWLVGATLSTWNFGSTGPRWSEIADFEPILAHSASAVSPMEKSSVNTRRKSTTPFPMSLRWSLYTLPLTPPNQSVNTSLLASMQHKIISE